MKRTILAAFFVCAAALPAPLRAEEQPLYRIFLQDGTALLSFGEYARQSDRVVFSMPVGVQQPPSQLQVVSIAESTVDWKRTEDYAEALRAKRYAETRGEEDFAALSNQVAAALNDVALTKDPAIRLALAEEARRTLAEWPRRNFGYRAADVRQLLWLFDDVVSQLRVAAGQPRYELALYADTAPSSHVSLLAPPDFRENIEQAMAAARVTQDPGERMSLLRAIATVLKPADASDWQAAMRARAVAELSAEERIDRAYGDLATGMLAAASTRARQADVLALRNLIRGVLETDDRLGRRRPQETRALLETLDVRLAEARQLRLARDAFALRAGVLKAYRGKVQVAVDYVARSTRWLEAIRELAGPAPRSLQLLEQRMSAATRILALLDPPREAQTGHATLGTAARMASRAAAIRRNAISSGNMTVAWEASSAAAGALLMFQSAVDEINRQTSFPRSR